MLNSGLIFVSGAIRNAITCEVTNGISDHKAVLLSLSNVYPDHKNGVRLFPNFLVLMMNLFWICLHSTLMTSETALAM